MTPVFDRHIILVSSLSHQEMGTVILGKLESGSISKAQQLVMMPNRVRYPTSILFRGQKHSFHLELFFSGGIISSVKEKNPNVSH